MVNCDFSKSFGFVIASNQNFLNDSFSILDLQSSIGLECPKTDIFFIFLNIFNF